MGCLSSKSVHVPSPLPPPPPRTPTPPPPPRENTEDFASDTVDIKYDERKDEAVSLPVQEKNDPAPCHVDPNNNNIKVTNHFFDDEDFNLSSEDVDLRELDNIKDDFSTDAGVASDMISDVISVIPRPAGKHIPKLSFAGIDEHARNAEDVHSETFEGLVKYLTRNIDANHDHREILTARAVLVWLSQQNTERNTHDDPTLTSPKGLIQNIQLTKMTYATCYTILCRKAGLSCTLVRGIVKAAGYEPGDENAPPSPWTAVFADGAWRIVNPFWVCKALFGHSLAGWVKIETDGKQMKQRTKASKGVARNAFQEYYFMPKPEHYVHECFPDETSWELLPKSLMIKSKEDFFKMPYLLPPFFGLGLELTSEQKCHLQTTDGTCKVQIKAKRSNGHMIVLSYELFVKEADNFDASNVQRMVFNSRSNEYFTFDIRFPTKGVFKFVIYGGPYKSPLLRLCEFKITCNEITGIDLLPLSVGNIGWGPGPATVDAGLYMPSRPSGLIVVPRNMKKTEVKFYIMKKFVNSRSYAAFLFDGKNSNDSNLKKFVKTEVIEETLSLTITVSLPHEGEFGLRITKESRIICNYLLSTGMQEKTNVKIAKEKLRQSVDELETEKSPEQWKKKLEECKSRMENCKKQKVDPSDEDLCIAERSIELYEYKNGLRDSINRRNLRVISLWLEYAKIFKYKMVIIRDIRRVENFKEQLTALRKLSRKVESLTGAFGFLSRPENPPGVVLNVYRTILLLKGFSPTELKTWDQVREKMGDPDTLLKYLKHINDSDIPKLQVDWATREFDDNKKQKVNERDHEEIYPLYKWVKDVLDIYRPKKH